MAIEHFDQLMRDREAAARAYVRGDPVPLGRLIARISPATFFGPGGGSVRGAAEVAARYERDATLFGRESETSFEIFGSAAGDQFAYWTGIQHAEVRIGDAAQSMDLRVTEIFLKEDDAWKLVHRHADPLAKAQQGR